MSWSTIIGIARLEQANCQYLVTLGTKAVTRLASKGVGGHRYYEAHHKKHVPHSSQLNGEGR